MRAINNVVLLICSAVSLGLAYAHPDLQQNATDANPVPPTPCPFVEIFNEEIFDDVESIEESDLHSMNIDENEQPTQLRGHNAMSQSSNGNPNVHPSDAIMNTNVKQYGRNQNQHVRGRGQNNKGQQVASQRRNTRVRCFTTDMYDEIDRDIWMIQNSIANTRQRGSFLGGLLRLVAHDAMDYDPFTSNPMGVDGCFDPNHPNNRGLESIWSDRSQLKQLYELKYSHISRADFWVASANAAVRQTSIGHQLNMKNNFRWGRTDTDTCTSQGDRLPSTRGCSETEDVFIRRMGMTWENAVSLMGAHTLGHGNARNSGHQGTWSDSALSATVFDKKYYEQIFMNNWSFSRRSRDWRTSNSADDRMMLNNDICLAYDIDGSNTCCTTGTSQCRQCPRYRSNHPRKEAERAVLKMLGGAPGNQNNAPFYESFREAWNKMTTAGQDTLHPLTTEECWI